MELDKGYVRILEGKRNNYYPKDDSRPVAMIHLDEVQSVRENKEPETTRARESAKRQTHRQPSADPSDTKLEESKQLGL